MKYKFCWNELLSHDVSKDKDFYCKLFNWEAQEIKSNEILYTVFKKDDKDIAGLMEWPEDHKNMPSVWFSYVSVDNVDEMAQKAEELGGKIHLQPMDIPKWGRIAVIQDTSGTAIGLFECKKDSCCCKK